MKVSIGNLCGNICFSDKVSRQGWSERPVLGKGRQPYLCGPDARVVYSKCAVVICTIPLQCRPRFVMLAFRELLLEVRAATQLPSVMGYMRGHHEYVYNLEAVCRFPRQQGILPIMWIGG